MGRARATCVVVAAIFTAALDVRAAEILRYPPETDPESSEEVAPIITGEGSGFYKPAASWLVMPSGLVEATSELARAVDEAKALLPPDAAAAAPAGVRIPEQAGLSTHTLRLATTLHFFDTVDAVAAYQVAASIASSPLFVAGSGGVIGSPISAPARRLVDFDPILVSDGGFALVHNLDQLSVALRSTAIHVVIGRQVISWGTGHLWNPTDLFSPFAPTDVDREVRRGADAARVSLPFGETSELDLIWLPQQDLKDNGGVIRARTNLFDIDLSLSLAKYVRDFVIGADLAADAGPFGLYAEGAWTQPIDVALETGDIDDEGGFFRGVVGASCRPTEIWTVIAEYYFNGFGSDDPAGYVEVLRSDRVARGEVFGAGRHYLGVASSWALTDLLALNATAIVNVRDPSANGVVSIEYSFDQSVLLRAGFSAPIGLGVDVAQFRLLHGEDLLNNSPAWQRATTTFGARSEYGLAPLSGFVQLGAYFG